jgi:SAM-dependent methyltransferase
MGQGPQQPSRPPPPRVGPVPGAKPVVVPLPVPAPPSESQPADPDEDDGVSLVAMRTIAVMAEFEETPADADHEQHGAQPAPQPTPSPSRDDRATPHTGMLAAPVASHASQPSLVAAARAPSQPAGPPGNSPSKPSSKIPPAPGTHAAADAGWTPGPSDVFIPKHVAPPAIATTDIEELEAEDIAPDSDRPEPAHTPPKPPPPPPPRALSGETALGPSSRADGQMLPPSSASPRKDAAPAQPHDAPPGAAAGGVGSPAPRAMSISDIEVDMSDDAPAGDEGQATGPIEVAIDAAAGQPAPAATPAMPSKPPPKVSVPPGAPPVSTPAGQPPPPPAAAMAQGAPQGAPPPPPAAAMGAPPPPPAAAMAAPPPPPPAAAARPAVEEPATKVPKAGMDTKKRQRPWWEEVFDDDFLRSMERLTDRQIQLEAGFIEDRLGLQKGAVVLDLACGAGRHAVELTKRGYKVVGYDLSLAMLARASDEAEAANQKINFLHGDMREMSFESMFDGVYSWGTSFGYFEEEKNFSVIQRIYRALRPGGVFLLDVCNRDFIAPRQPNLVWFEGEGSICMDETNLDFITSRLKVKRTLMLEDGRTRELDYSIRLYGLNELGRVLHDAGFRVLEVSGQLATPGVFFGSESPRCIVLAERS